MTCPTTTSNHKIVNQLEMLMHSHHAVLLAAALTLAACSGEPKSFDELNIQPIQTGPVPAETFPDTLPTEEGVVAYSREDDRIVTAYYRKTIECPTQMINSISGIKAKSDRILLCFEPVESDDPDAAPLSKCPYDLVIQYEMAGIPTSVEPKFEATDDCS